jgi:threonine dehydrogenase-like Zn-dependent dehydrogenase
LALGVELARSHREALASMVTHRFPLDDWADAVRVCRDRTNTHAVKVVLKP